MSRRLADRLDRLDRLRGRYTGELDEDRNPIPARRHHPAEPKRTRPTRFLLGLTSGLINGPGEAILLA